jgi:hypothetical protein
MSRRQPDAASRRTPGLRRPGRPPNGCRTRANPVYENAKQTQFRPFLGQEQGCLEKTNPIGRLGPANWKSEARNPKRTQIQSVRKPGPGNGARYEVRFARCARPLSGPRQTNPIRADRAGDRGSGFSEQAHTPAMSAPCKTNPITPYVAIPWQPNHYIWDVAGGERQNKPNRRDRRPRLGIPDLGAGGFEDGGSDPLKWTECKTNPICAITERGLTRGVSGARYEIRFMRYAST